MIRILQISKYYYPFVGGIEQVANDIANVFSRHCIEQKIICFNENVQNSSLICHRNETVHDIVNGVEVIRCGCQAKLFSQSISFSYAKELKKVLDDFKPDIIIFHYPNPFVAHLLLKYKKRNFKLFLYWHLDITKQKFLKHFFRHQNISIITRADKILGATPKHLDESEYSMYFTGKKELLPYTIDEKNLQITQEEIKEAESLRAKNKGTVIAFFIGRHVPYKGLQYLIGASAELKNIPLKIYIAGQGELTEKLKEQAKGDDKIIFLGPINNSEKRIYLYACDIFCFPSVTRNEAFGLALAEGMYYGKPAVTFTIKGSGVNYVNLDGETGIECLNADSHAYAIALRKLVEDAKLREKLGEAARVRIKNNFSETKFDSNMMNLIFDNLK